jgi:D-sedoheptulose 7-phosphate isomerase
MKENIKNQILESAKIKNKIIEQGIEQIEKAAEIFINCTKNGGKIFWCGNGGSAGDAQHLATELMGGMTDHDRKPIPSLALTTDSSFLTAWSNDTDFDSIFSRQIQGLGEEGDVLVGISTSGNSKNVINALKQAKYKNIKTISLTGKTGGELNGIADVTIKVPSNNTQRIQESHIMIGQILCGLLESSLVKK